MTERIDHAAEARQCLGLIADIGYASDHGYRKQEYLAEAHVHATLALVEQQRAANIIAVMSSAARSVAEGTHSIADYLAMFQRLNPEVARILGIGEKL